MRGVKARHKILLTEKTELQKKLTELKETYLMKSRNDDLLVETLRRAN